MKLLLTTILFSVFTTSLFAQKLLNPEVKAGTVLYYDAYLKNAGSNAQLELTFIETNDPIKMHWSVTDYGKGEWEMQTEALNNALKTTLEPPEPDHTTKMKKDETLLVLSRAAYAEAIKNNSFQLNGMKFNVIADTAVYRINNNRPVASFHAITDNKKAEVWILNNPNFPLLLQGKNLTKGIDFWLMDVKQK